MKKYPYLIFHLFLGISILYLSTQCHQKTDYKQSNVEEVIKKIDTLPVTKRLKKWDSILDTKNIDELSKGYILFEKANDLTVYKKDKEAIILYKKALKIFEKKNIQKMTAKTLVNLAISYAYTNQKNHATQTLFKGLNIANKTKDSTIISRIYAELAHIYYLEQNLDKAIEYLKKTQELIQKKKDSEAISIIYNNIAIIYQEQGNYKKAYQYALKSIDLNKNKTSINSIETYNNLGLFSFQQTKDKKLALNYYYKALHLATKNHFQPVLVYSNLSDLYDYYGQLDSARYFIEKALSIPNDNYKDKLQLYDKLLHITLKQNKNYEALKVLKIKDSLNQILGKMSTSENEKNIENNLTLLNKQKQLAQVQKLNNKNRIIFIFIILIFLLGLLISYQLNRLDRLRYKQNQFILEQKVLRSQMNPHFIFNVLSSIQNSLVENKPIVSATYLSKFAQLIRQNFDYVQKKYISINEELKMLRNYLDTQKFRYQNKFDYQVIVDESINHQITKIPPMILQPFVENAIEHGFKNIDYKGELTINIYKHKNKICFEIIDNGTGFKPKKDDKEHAVDIFKKRLRMMGKETFESFKITKLNQGTKILFCLQDNKSSN